LVLRVLRVLLRILIEVRKLKEVEFDVYKSCPWPGSQRVYRKKGGPGVSPETKKRTRLRDG
jgi:hypothetical protein